MSEFKIFNMGVFAGLKKMHFELPPYCYLNEFHRNNSMVERNFDGTFIISHHYSPSTEFKKGHQWREPQPYWNKEFLEREYTLKQKSSKEIAIQNRCTENNILYFLKKFNIKTRSMREIRKLKTWGLSGSDNPMFNKSGEANPNWKGGITKERQLFYSSIKWKTACSFVWKRDNGVCQRCQINFKSGVPFHIHHIVSFSDKKLRAEPENLILVCEVCHHYIHSKKNIKKEFIGELPTKIIAGGESKQ